MRNCSVAVRGGSVVRTVAQPAMINRASDTTNAMPMKICRTGRKVREVTNADYAQNAGATTSEVSSPRGSHGKMFRGGAASTHRLTFFSMRRTDISFTLLTFLIVGYGCRAAELGHTGAATSQPVTTQYVITDFGAREDATTLNTGSIQAAVDRVASAGGGTVVIPQGVFLSGAIFLKPNVNLQLERQPV